MAFKKTVIDFSKIAFDCTQWFLRRGGLEDIDMIRKLDTFLPRPWKGQDPQQGDRGESRRVDRATRRRSTGTSRSRSSSARRSRSRSTE